MTINELQIKSSSKREGEREGGREGWMKRVDGEEDEKWAVEVFHYY